jgi:phosphatidylinositol glycan class B
MILGFAAWLLCIQKAGFRNLATFTLGVLLVFLSGIMIDRWFYGDWTLTSWNYFRYNLLLGKASAFGTYPWWYYFEQTFMNALPPFSLVYILAVLIFVICKPKDLLTWTIVPFLVAHFIIGHKEIRFLFPIIGFIPVMIIFSADFIMEKKGIGIVQHKAVKFFIKAFWYTNLVMLAIVVFRPADDQISLYKKLYYNYPSATILYYIEGNPYHRVVDIYYYKRKNLVIKHIDSLSRIVPRRDTSSLLVMNKPELPRDSRLNPVLIYSSFPQWMKRYNFNHWVERTNFWYVYELRL